MTRPSRRRTSAKALALGLPVGLLVGLAAGACGASAEEQLAVDSLTTAMGSGVNADQSRLFGPDYPACFAEEFVSEAGLDRLMEDGVVTEEGQATTDLNSSLLSEETAEAYAEAEYACIDFDAMSTFLVDSGELAPATPAQVGDYVTCLSDIPADQWRAATADQARSEIHTDAVETFNAAVEACRQDSGVAS